MGRAAQPSSGGKQPEAQRRRAPGITARRRPAAASGTRPGSSRAAAAQAGGTDHIRADHPAA